MRVFITGSSGFVGKEITSQLKRNGHFVVGLDRNEPVDISKKPDLFIKKDIKDVVSKDVEGCEYIIHLAAECTPQRVFEKDLYGNYTSNITAFLELMEIAHRLKVKKFVYASSSAVYGRYYHRLETGTNKVMMTEEDRVFYGEEQNHYGKSKMVNEIIAQSYHDAYGMTNIGIRIMNAFGEGEMEKGGSACAPTQMILQKRAGKTIEIYGDGKQAKDFIYITDCASIIIRLMEKADDGVYNVGTGIATNFNRLAELVGGESKHVKNPNSYYPLLTRGGMKKTLKAIGDYKFISVEEGIERAKKYYGVG
ncbi:MAG: NAD(P)-dependent oxidoreductase [Candidatus Micrarchaeota archaeon]|nr:NAD(P)-dependent oxidoreductase [Candidatus Micrarchaeota archaeon]